jgi:hypothetical protein
VLFALWGCGRGAPSSRSDAPGSEARAALSAGELDGVAAAAADGVERPPARCLTGTDAQQERALGALPRQLAGFCVDAYSRVRSYGSDAPEPIERACEQILGPGCNGGRELGLTRLVALAYRDQRGGSATLDLIVSVFEDADGAYANFTGQLIGERDPLQIGARAFEAPGLAVLDGARAAGWLGRYVVGLQYGDPPAPSEQRSADAAQRLPDALRRVLETLPNEPDLPLAVQKLPSAHRVPLGARLLLGDVLGIPGIGAGAIGYYRDGEKRWRVLAVVRPDADSARDVLGTLTQSPAVRPIRNAPLEAYAFTERRLPKEPYVGWVVGQRQEVIYGVGDEATALPELMTAEREAAVKLSLADKLVKLTRTHIE